MEGAESKHSPLGEKVEAGCKDEPRSFTCPLYQMGWKRFPRAFAQFEQGPAESVLILLVGESITSGYFAENVS